MTFEETIEAFRRGAFEIDFTAMTWVRGKSTEPDNLRGPGSAVQTSTGPIDVKCHAVASKETRPSAALERDMSRQSGELYDENDHYTCDAVDVRGARWRISRSLMIRREWSIPERAGVVMARGVEVVREQRAKPGAHELNLIFFEQDHREWNAFAHADQEVMLASSKYAFAISILPDRSDQIKVALKSQSAFPEAFERRVVEALQFVLGQTLQVAISETKSDWVHTLALRSPTRLPQIPHPYPPLNTRYGDNGRDIFKLFGLYLDYISTFADEKVWHASSNFLTLARNASGVSLDSWAIGLGVAVEGVANLIEFDAPTHLRPEHDKARAAIDDVLTKNGAGQSLRQRIKGMLKGLDSVRARDRMESLVPLGRALGDDTISWSAMRNSAVHTKTVSAENFTREKLQEEIDRVHRGIRLLYSIIFHLIGYEGEFTDYAQRNFPDTRYPFAVPPIETEAADE